MLATWKASAGFVRIMICFHLILAFSQISNNEAYIWSQAIRCGRILSNEIKLDHGFHLRNLDGISRQAQMACVTATAPALFSLTLQAGVQPALISIKPFQRLLMPITRATRSVDIGVKTKPLKGLNFISRGEPPARHAMLIGAQLTAQSKGGTKMLAIFPVKPGLIFDRA